MVTECPSVRSLERVEDRAEVVTAAVEVSTRGECRNEVVVRRSKASAQPARAAPCSLMVGDLSADAE